MAHTMAPDIAPLRPTTGTLESRGAAAAFREIQFPPTVRVAPAVRFLNLEGAHPVDIAALRELLLPVAQAIRADAYGAFAIGVITSDESVADYVEALATQFQVPMFVSDRVQDFWSHARPVGDLTQSERDTLNVISRLGGSVTSGALADEAGLEPAAAGNRLSNIEKKGYVFRIARSRKDGDLFLSPTASPQSTTEIASNQSESLRDPTSLVPMEMRDEVLAMSQKMGVALDVVVAAAWKEYILRHKDEARREVDRLGGLIRSGDTGQLTEELSSGVNERARIAADRRKRRDTKS